MKMQTRTLSFVIAVILFIPASSFSQEWTHVAPYAIPINRFRHSMVADPGRNVIVMFGGLVSAIGQHNDTHEWNGTYWTYRSTTNSPSKRYAAGAMAYNSNTGEIILFGGSAIPGYSNETWQYNGTNWTEIHTSNSPPVRSDANLVYDSVRKVFVLYGGIHTYRNPDTSESFNIYHDTWEFDGSNWTEINTVDSPANHFGNMVYDSQRNLVYFYDNKDIYSYNGINWTKLTPTNSPPPRSQAVMYYDSNEGITVLFGGSTGNSPYLTDTWKWDGTNWTQLYPTHSPPPRFASSVAYNPITRKAILFGGFNGSSALSDTWEFSIDAVFTPTPVPTCGPCSMNNTSPTSVPTAINTPMNPTVPTHVTKDISKTDIIRNSLSKAETGIKTMSGLANQMSMAQDQKTKIKYKKKFTKEKKKVLDNLKAVDNGLN